MESKAGFFFVAHLEVAESDGRGFPPKDERLEPENSLVKLHQPKTETYAKKSNWKKTPKNRGEY